MIGLIVLIVSVVYFALLIWATRSAYRWAKKRGWSRGKCWGAAVGGFLVVYLPVFWDHIPTLIAHKYYCEKEAGFWVYKTPEQWKKENPEVALIKDGKTRYETLRHDEYMRISRVWVNERLYLQNMSNDEYAHAISRYEMIFADATTGSELAKSIDFRRGYGAALMTGQGRPFQELKFWLGAEEDYCNEASPSRRMMNLLRGKFGYF